MAKRLKRNVSLDQDVAQGYARFLIEAGSADSPQARQDYCKAKAIHPKLLYYNPHIRSLESLFSDRSNVERLMDMTVREWTLYHHHYVHQAYRYGDSEMQQRWLDHDILKSPFDCWIYQELIYKIKPDFIVELGIMFGGATHFYASICDLVGHGQVVGVDISLAKVKSVDNARITLVEGSSSSQETFEKVKGLVNGGTALVIADSDHEKNHCLAELRLFSKLVTVGSYYVVEDSLNDPMHWHPVPNEGPQAAALAFMDETDDFVIDTRYAEKYIFSLSPLGFLLRVK
ncbi:MAG TPA: CmcI family methyltransferase [Pyrinomonadaceae bacterium]